MEKVIVKAAVVQTAPLLFESLCTLDKVAGTTRDADGIGSPGRSDPHRRASGCSQVLGLKL